MPNEQLVAHIHSELARGVDKSALIQSLIAAGWKVEDINAAMNGTAPAPSQNIPATPRAPVQSAPVASAQEVSCMKTLVQNTASGLFIACVFILTVVGILGGWALFCGDVLSK